VSLAGALEPQAGRPGRPEAAAARAGVEPVPPGPQLCPDDAGVDLARGFPTVYCGW